MRSLAFLAFALSLGAAAAPAAAVCSSASLEREYREADVVVRARVVAETRIFDDEPSAAARRRWGEGPVLLYRLRVIERFKGAPGPTISFFEEINSGAFYVDLGGDYLLFFHYYRVPATRFRARPAARCT